MRCLLTVVMILLLACCGSCATHASLPSFKKLESYRFAPTSSLTSRVSAIPPVLLEALKKIDGRDDYLPYILTPDEQRQFSAALDDLPEIQRTALYGRLVGIYFVQNFSSGGYSDYILDQDGTLYTVLVLNPAILHTPLADWIAYKELSAFAPDANGAGLKLECGPGEHPALLYLLLHETAHQLDYLAGCTPYVEKDLAGSGTPLSTSPFVADVWRDYDHPLPPFDFPWRDRLGFYGAGKTPKPTRSELADVYRCLAETPFVTLYASQNWAEDFAETAAFAALARIKGITCRMSVQAPGAERFEFPVIDRPKVVVRLPHLYQACKAAARQEK